MRISFNPRQPIIVRAFIAGPKGIRAAKLVLDTGAAKTMIKGSRLSLVGIEPETGLFQVTTSATDVKQMPMALLSSLALGEHQRTNLPVVVHNLPGVTEIDGLLGMDFLAGLHVSIRMRHGILTLEEDSDTL